VRGLNDTERYLAEEILRDATACADGALMARPPYTPAEIAALERLRERGVLQYVACRDHAFGACHHPLVTPAGKQVMEMDRMARESAGGLHVR
jgi:hypothetical protein